MPRYGRHRFGRPRPKPAVTVNTSWPLRKNRKCDACKGRMTAGELVTRFALAKRNRQPCSVCTHVPKRTKYFHPACSAGLDPNTAMGYDPNAGRAAPPVQHQTAPPPMPPKPPTFEEASLAAMLAFEGVLKAKIGNPRNATDDQRAAFGKYQRIKARAINPGSVAEGETSTGFALRELIKLIYNS